jgi:hypothetical protein
MKNPSFLARDLLEFFLKSILDFQAVPTGEQVEVRSDLLVKLNSDAL